MPERRTPVRSRKPSRKEARIKSRRHGSILVSLLWCLALLSLVVFGFLHSTRTDLQVGKNYGDRIQAHYLALAGIEKAKALLYQDARDRSRSKQNHNGRLYDKPEDFRGVTLGRGEFQVFRRGREDEGGGVIYGVSDEESRLNVNTATSDQLGKLNGISSNTVAAIVDWRDSDNAVSPGGAEADYYGSLQPPSQPRNGPFQTIRELLMVRGVSSSLLFGNDSHQNGLLEASPDNGAFVNEHVADDDLGWSGIITVASSVKNVNAAGEDRVNVQNADESALTGVPGISPDIARAIVSYRGQNQLQSIADLLSVTPQNRNGSGSTNRNAAAGGGSTSGRPVISEELFLDIADDVTVDSNQDGAGLVNINTASLSVLAALPGLDRQLAQSIISFRQSNGFLANTGWLLRVPGMTRDIFRQVAPAVTARSETFRILSEGRVSSSGVRQRIETVVHVGLDDLRVLAYREDDL